jgi:DNA-directed RNA polymerase specialized sigma24 family protein
MIDTPQAQPAIEGPDEVPDKLLATRAQDGDSQAMAGLYDRHVDSVYRHMKRCVRGDDATAEDLVHDTFIQVIRAFDDGRFDPERDEAFRAWLMTIATNVCRSHFRRQSSRPALEDPMPTDDPWSESEPMASFGPDPLPPILLDELLDQLPPLSRRVMRFRRHHPDLSEAECAARLGMELEAYRKSVRRSFSRLRELAGAGREELLDATYPWRNRGAEESINSQMVRPSQATMDPDARQRVQVSILAAHAALRGQG